METFDSSFPSLESFICPSFCYFRSIPLQPSLDHFHKANESAPSVKQLAFDVGTKSATCNPKPQDSSRVPQSNHLLLCGERLEPLRQSYGANVVIAESSRSFTSTSSIPHQLDLPINRVDTNELICSIKDNRSVTATLRIVSGRRKPSRVVEMESLSEDECIQTEIVDRSITIAHINAAYLKPFEIGHIKLLSNTEENKYKAWLDVRKKKWNENFLLRKVRTTTLQLLSFLYLVITFYFNLLLHFLS